MFKNESIRSASGGFSSSDVEASASVTQLTSWRFTVHQDILSIQMQINRWRDSPTTRKEWMLRANTCLKLQEILMSKIEERIFKLENDLQ
jgi:hypothetical protein